MDRINYDISQMINVIRRGTAEILEQDEDGVFLYDTKGTAYMLACTDVEKGKRWLKAHEDRNYELFAIVGRELAEYAFQTYDLPGFMDCRQYVYIKEDLPQITGTEKLSIRVVEDRDKEFIHAHYDHVEEDVQDITIAAKEMLIGELDGKYVGFVGEHLEGSMGILYVLPEYRGRGFATQLEVAQIKIMQEKGFIPFGHIVEGNESSVRLQEKLGFIETERVFWIY